MKTSATLRSQAQSSRRSRAGVPPEKNSPSGRGRFLHSRQGSVLIIVMWTCFGLVALTLYFAQSMSSELRAADNRVVEVAARQAFLGGVRYVTYVLTNFAASGKVPLSNEYKAEALPVGEAYFWLIGRDANQTSTTTPEQPFFGIVDECSKLNLNTATAQMLQQLPGVTPEFAAAIVAWHSSARTANGGGASANTYSALDPPRRIKNANFETTDELRLVYGATLDIILGEDTNRNGALDPNENDSDKTPPHDNQNGQLDAGILEYVTVYSQQPNTRATGGPRFNVSTQPSRSQGLLNFLQTKFGRQRASDIFRRLGTRTLNSVAEFCALSGMTSDEFLQIHTDITVKLGATVPGLININTAGYTVLSCIPGILLDKAAAVVAYRQSHQDTLTSLAWLKDVIGEANFIEAGPYITDQSFRYSADVAAVGKSGRGYCREKIVFDTSKNTPRILFRQDLSSYGWALGSDVRAMLKTAKQSWQ